MGVTAEKTVYENHPADLPSVAGVTWVDMQNYRDPPPYPGHSKQVFTNQPGFRQSFSGSEASTDVSLSSTENLATSQRQEPQGEENHSPFYHHHHQNQHQNQQQHHQQTPHHQYYHYNHYQQHDDELGDGTSNSYSILARLGMPPGGLLESSSSSTTTNTTSSSSTGVKGGFGLNIQQQNQQRGGGMGGNGGQQQSSHQQYLNHHHHHLVTNSVTTTGNAGESGSVGISNSRQYHHQLQHHSLGGGGGGGGHFNVPANPTTGSGSQPLTAPAGVGLDSITNNTNVAFSSSGGGVGGGADPLYCHGNQLTVPHHWKAGDSNNNNNNNNSNNDDIYNSSGSRKNSSSGLLYSHQQQKQQQFQDSSSSSSNTFANRDNNNLVPPSSPAFSSSLVSSSSSSLYLSSSSSTTKMINQQTSQSGTITTTPSISSSSSSSSALLSSSNERVNHPHPLHHHQPIADYASSRNQPPLPSHPYLSPRVPPVSTYHHPHPYVNAHYSFGSDEQHDDAYTTSTTPSSQWSSHQSQSQSRTPTPYQRGVSPNPTTSNPPPPPISSSTLPPPPIYPVSGVGMTGIAQRLIPPHNMASSISTSGSASIPRSLLSAATDTNNIRPCRSYETIVDKMDKLMDATSSGLAHHPDIRLSASSPGIYVPHHARSPVRSANASSDDGSSGIDHVAKASSRMVDALTEENRTLRDELAVATVKVSRLSKFEMEVHKMHEGHESLLQSHQKRESLWLAMRRKLEERIRCLEESNAGGHPDVTKATSSVTESDLRSRLMEKESLITRLLTQNQELLANRNQLEAENLQMTLTLSEQRAHVDIVEKALVGCQAKVLMMAEAQHQEVGCNSSRCTHKVAKEESSSSSDKPPAADGGGSESLDVDGLDDDQPHHHHHHHHQLGMGVGGEGSSDCAWKLDQDMARLKQTYRQESSPSLCLDESSHPLKELRLAALEKNASDVEKLIDEAKTEKLKHMEELHESNKKVAELEAKVKQLSTQLVEKEAMVKVFQRTPYTRLPRSSSLHALCHHSPVHSPRPSLIASSSSSSTQATSSTSGSGGTHKEFSSVRHMKTGSTSAIDMGRKLSIEEDLLIKVQSLSSNCETKDNSTEEVRLWHV